MQGMISKVQRFLISEDGPTAVEYALMVGLVAVAAIGGITALGTSINTKFDGLSTSIAS